MPVNAGTLAAPRPGAPLRHQGVIGAPTPVRPHAPLSQDRLPGSWRGPVDRPAAAHAGVECMATSGFSSSLLCADSSAAMPGRPSLHISTASGSTPPSQYLRAGCAATGDVPRRINTVPGGSRFVQLEVCHASASVVGAVIERLRAESGVSRPPVSSIRRIGTMSINSQEGSTREDARMSNHPNIDETIVLDLSIYRRELVRHLHRDGVFCDGDARIVALFDAPHQELSRITRCRRALESALHGITRHTRALASDAGVAFVADGQQVTNVTQLPIDTRQRSDRGTDPSAA